MGKRAVFGAVISAVACGLALTGCGSGTAAAPAKSTPPPTPVSLDEHDNGRTVHVTVGSPVTVTLHSTYWSFTPLAAAKVLRTDAAPSVAPGGGCGPGIGCGTVTVHFTAVAAGTAEVAAGRTSCGEAMQCPPGQGTYQVTVEVDN